VLGVFVALLVDVESVTVTLPFPSNCNNPALSAAPLTAPDVSAKPVVLNVYEPERVAVEHVLVGCTFPLPE
jgi:hypothetical protein